MNSYTAANEFPWKILKDLELLESIYYHKKIPARHVQLSPTNKCNLNCPYCSCKLRKTRQQWLFKDTVEGIPNILDEIGTVGVTITGGGEPFLFPYIDELIMTLHKKDIAIGIVSNGTIPCSEPIPCLVTWARFSFSDDRVVDNRFVDTLEGWLGKGVDLAFSYVVTNNINYKNVDWIVNYANEHDFTHVRMVSDILDEDSAKNIEEVRQRLKQVGIDDSLVIYQSRKSYTPGNEKCLISLLKPMIYSDGYVYPCCGSQYALSDDLRHMPKSMRMGHYTDLPTIIKEQCYFDGNVCNVCYYEQYNTVLNNLMGDMKHLEFV